MQWLGARGLNPGYQATPDLQLTRRHGWVKLARILAAEGKTWKPPQDEEQAALYGRDVCHPGLFTVGCVEYGCFAGGVFRKPRPQ